MRGLGSFSFDKPQANTQISQRDVGHMQNAKNHFRTNQCVSSIDTFEWHCEDIERLRLPMIKLLRTD